MWNELFKLAKTALEIGAVVVAVGLTAEVLSRAFTNKGLLENTFEWWNRARERIVAWCQSNEKLGIAKVVAHVTEVLDDTAVNLKRLVNLMLGGVDRSNGQHLIQEQLVPANELAQLFPELRNRTSATVLELNQ